jgi:hypothetical protein
VRPEGDIVRFIADIQHFVIFEKLLEVSGYQADPHDNNSGFD